MITDRKSARLNSSHLVISYAVFCLKKKNHDRGANAPGDGLSIGQAQRGRCERPSPAPVAAGAASDVAALASAVFLFFFFLKGGPPPTSPLLPPPAPLRS